MNGLSGSITSTSSTNNSLEGKLTLTVNWTQVYTPGNNYSDVEISANVTRANSGNAAGGTWYAWNDGSISVNGTAAITFHAQSTTGVWTTAGQVGWTGSGTVRVYHTAATSVSVSIDSVKWHNTTYSNFDFTIPAQSTTITLQAITPQAIPQKYTLSTSSTTGSWLTINRTSSPKAGATTGVLSSGTTIYDGDILQISGGANEGYNFGGLLLNNNSFSSGNTHTVSGNVSVSATASVKSYTLKLSQGTGTNLSVYRSSSPKGGASAGRLSNGSIIYYSDVLQISGSANDGYNFGGLTVNSGTFTSGDSITITQDVSVATTASVKSYTLTINQGIGTNLSIYRSSSPKAGAAAEYLNSGATIYYSDTLQISGSAQVGYDFGRLIVNSSSFSSGETHTVTSNVLVSTSATVQQFILTINQDTGTIITVDRIISPNKGAEAGKLENGAAIYYGDILQITASFSSGWEITSLTINGSPFSSGRIHTVSGNTTIVSKAKPHGLVYISENGTFSAYQVYIYNGTEWDMYTPYISDGVDWALQS